MSFGYQAIPLEGVQIFHGVGVDEPSPDQFHAELELGWVQQGKVRLQPARSDEPGPIAAAGEAVLIGPGVAHSVEVVERCTFLVAYVHPDLARRLLGAAHLRGVLVFPATQPLQAALHERADTPARPTSNSPKPNRGRT
ncbi:MAG: AraC family ligand binding domain-containing protein [Planctomycetota bacterium]